MVRSLGLALWLTGCTEPEESGATTVDTTNPCGDTTWDSTNSWDTTGFWLTACPGLEGSYELGLVATGATDGWGGEDCLPAVPAGYDNVDDAGVQICHPLDGDSTQLRSVETVERVVAGESTLFSDEDEGTLTYVLFDVASPACLSWGHDPGYYRAYSCTEL